MLTCHKLDLTPQFIFSWFRLPILLTQNCNCDVNASVHLLNLNLTIFMAASATSVAILPAKLVFRGRVSPSKSTFLAPSSTSSIPCQSTSISCRFRRHKPFGIQASISVSDPQVRTGLDDLVASILSKVMFRICLVYLVFAYWN